MHRFRNIISHFEIVLFEREQKKNEKIGQAMKMKEVLSLSFLISNRKWCISSGGQLQTNDFMFKNKMHFSYIYLIRIYINNKNAFSASVHMFHCSHSYVYVHNAQAIVCFLFAFRRQMYSYVLYALLAIKRMII